MLDQKLSPLLLAAGVNVFCCDDAAAAAVATAVPSSRCTNEGCRLIKNLSSFPLGALVRGAVALVFETPASAPARALSEFPAVAAALVLLFSSLCVQNTALFFK